MRSTQRPTAGDDRPATTELLPCSSLSSGYPARLSWMAPPTPSRGKAGRARSVAETWTTVRGNDRVLGILAPVFHGLPPASGLRITPHKPCSPDADLPLALVTGTALARRLAVAATQDTRVSPNCSR